MAPSALVTVRSRYESPVGTLWLVASAKALRGVSWREPPAKDKLEEAGEKAGEVLDRALRALEDYFAGRADPVGRVPVDLAGLAPFHRRVLETVAACVPFGETVSYGELAEMVGRPRAARAVGGAMAANPVPIFVPCHRVLGAQGLGGFGPGPDVKRRLLSLEGHTF